MTECPDCGQFFRGKKCSCGYDPKHPEATREMSLCSHPGCRRPWVISGKCREHSELNKPKHGEPISKAQAQQIMAELFRRYPHLKRRAA